jgi:hypothetical protein
MYPFNSESELRCAKELDCPQPFFATRAARWAANSPSNVLLGQFEHTHTLLLVQTPFLPRSTPWQLELLVWGNARIGDNPGTTNSFTLRRLPALTHQAI